MTKPKKKDPAAQMAADAAVAFAIERVADDPRGAPETFHVEPAPEPVVVAAPPMDKPCALESAPIGAKCVVSRTEAGKAVRLLTPAGAEPLDLTDLFYTLPAGAKVQKVGPSEYVAYRLGVQEAPLFTVPTARLAVARFLEVVA